jgi:DNA-directed RNA polymerase specialized sigma24 family protein
MTKEQIDDLFARWARWALMGNRAGLGITMSSYAERISSKFSSADSPVPVDPEVLRADEAIRRLPTRHREVVVAHYLRPGPAKQKAAILHMSRDAYYEYIAHSKEFVVYAMYEAA